MMVPPMDKYRGEIQEESIALQHVDVCQALALAQSADPRTKASNLQP